MGRKNQTRKCKYCDKNIDLKTDKWLKEKKRYIHKQCLIDREIEKGHSKEHIDSIIEQLVNQYEEEQRMKMQIDLNKRKHKEEQKIKSLEDKEKRKEYKTKFVQYIQNTYNLKVLPQYFFIKLSNINNGTYKGLSRGIPYEDLLDMFKRKQKQLDKMAFNKKKYGKEFKNQLGRVYFDIAVIVNQYDSYLKWREKQKKLEIEKTKKTNNIFEFVVKEKNKIENRHENVLNTEKDLDINTLLDEI